MPTASLGWAGAEWQLSPIRTRDMCAEYVKLSLLPRQALRQSPENSAFQKVWGNSLKTGPLPQGKDPRQTVEMVAETAPDPAGHGLQPSRCAASIPLWRRGGAATWAQMGRVNLETALHVQMLCV